MFVSSLKYSLVSDCQQVQKRILSVAQKTSYSLALTSSFFLMPLRCDLFQSHQTTCSISTWCAMTLVRWTSLSENPLFHFFPYYKHIKVHTNNTSSGKPVLSFSSSPPWPNQAILCVPMAFCTDFSQQSSLSHRLYFLHPFLPLGQPLKIL